MRKLFFLLVIGLMLVGDTALAQTGSTIPEFNPLCWKKIDCYNAKAKVIDASKNYNELTPEDKKMVENGFIPNQDPCMGGEGNDQWGKCLPGSTAQTQVAFGGRRDFLNIGDFIQSNYVFLISIAGILSAVMIVIAGFQWVTSGGNAESISSAKHRINGALIGLFIAYMSYFILNTISPNLVNLRLPQTWMVRSQELVPRFCSAAPSSTMYYKAFDSSDQKSKVTIESGVKYNLTKENILDIGANIAACGSRFVMEKGGSATCYGDLCPNGSMCANFDSQGNPGDYRCLQASIAGRITYQSLGTLLPTCLKEGWDPAEITDATDNLGTEVELWAICNRGNGFEVTTADAKTTNQKNSQFYTVSASIGGMETAMQQCAAYDGFAGFVMMHEFNEGCDGFDEPHVIGKNGVDLGLDGADYPFAITPNFNLEDDVFNNISRSKKYFFSLEELKKGILVNIDASNVKDVDEEADMSVYNRL